MEGHTSGGAWKLCRVEIGIVEWIGHKWREGMYDVEVFDKWKKRQTYGSG